MASNKSGQSFANDAERQADYGDFLRRFQQDPTSISAEEAARRYSELVSHASPELVVEANRMTFGQLPAQDREVLAGQFMEAQQDPNRPFDSYTYDDPNQAAAPGELGRMTLQAGQKDPGLLERLLGPDSPLNTPLGRMVISTAVAYLASRIFGNQRQQGGVPASQGVPASGGGLADLISIFLGGGGQPQAGGLPAGLPSGLGGLLGALAQGSGQMPSGSGIPGGLGGLLDALEQGGGQRPASGAGLPSGLGDLLGALAGGGGQSQAGGLPGGLGDLLGALAGGAPAADQPPAGSNRPGVLLQGIAQQSESSGEQAPAKPASGQRTARRSHRKK
jgi:hypothetical protein